MPNIFENVRNFPPVRRIRQFGLDQLRKTCSQLESIESRPYTGKSREVLVGLEAGGRLLEIMALYGLACLGLANRREKIDATSTVFDPHIKDMGFVQRWRPFLGSQPSLKVMEHEIGGPDRI